MKRLALLAALLLAVSACSSTPETTNSNTATPAANTAANANTSATPTTGATVKDSDITAKEQEIWDKIKAKDSDGFGQMLADDFIYVAPEGVLDKAGTVNSVKDYNPTEVNFSDWKVLMLDKDAALVVYSVTAKGTSGGKPIPETPVRCSSIWVNRGGKWVGVFHQETEPKQGPPATPPPASAKPAATASATPTPASKPAEASSDVVANENMVWDLLKKKDYDGFASLLSEKSIEVEESGVYDKAGSVKGVSGFDFSKATLSDFKTVKLTDNSSLVTYLVKIPVKGVSPLGERHSTVWSNSDGKWLAMFHQGTPVKAAPKSK